MSFANSAPLVEAPLRQRVLTKSWIGVTLALLLCPACKEKNDPARPSTTTQTSASPIIPPSAQDTEEMALAQAAYPQKPSEPPPHVSTFLRLIPQHLEPRYDPHSPAGVDWIRVNGPLIGDNRWLVLQFSSNEEAEARAVGTRQAAPRDELATNVFGERTKPSEGLMLIPVSGTEPRRFRMSKGTLTLEGDAKPQLFNELTRTIAPDRFWPQAGVEIDGQGTALTVLDLGTDKLKTIVQLQNYIWPRMLMRDLERIIFPLPALVGHVPNPEHAQQIKAELEAVGAKVKFTPPK